MFHRPPSRHFASNSAQIAEERPAKAAMAAVIATMLTGYHAFDNEIAKPPS